MVIKCICCVCGIVYRDGETINGYASHGLCDQCYDIEMLKLKSAEIGCAAAPYAHPHQQQTEFI